MIEEEEEPPFFPLFRDRNISWVDVTGRKESKYVRENREKKKKYLALLQRNPDRLETVVTNLVAYRFYEKIIRNLPRDGNVYKKLQKIHQNVEGGIQIHYQDLITVQDLEKDRLKRSEFLNGYKFVKKKSFSNNIIMNPIAYGTVTGEKYYLKFGEINDWYIGDKDGATKFEEWKTEKLPVSYIAFVICGEIQEQSRDEISFKERFVFVRDGKVASDILNDVIRETPIIEGEKLTEENVIMILKQNTELMRKVKNNFISIEENKKLIVENRKFTRQTDTKLDNFIKKKESDKKEDTELFKEAFKRLDVLKVKVEKYDEKFGKQKEQVMAMLTEQVIKNISKKLTDKTLEAVNRNFDAYKKRIMTLQKDLEKYFNNKMDELEKKYELKKTKNKLV
jgi:hypothetical protein